MKACQKGGAKRVNGEKREEKRSPGKETWDGGSGCRCSGTRPRGGGGGNLGGSGGGLEYEEEKRRRRRERKRGRRRNDPFLPHFISREKKVKGGRCQR